VYVGLGIPIDCKWQIRRETNYALQQFLERPVGDRLRQRAAFGLENLPACMTQFVDELVRKARLADAGITQYCHDFP